MPRIEIYTTLWCPYCDAAKALLAERGAHYSEIDAGDPELRKEMIQRAHGRRTVPQIFVDGRHIGGYHDLAALAYDGSLDTLLAAADANPVAGSPPEH
ncbi:MAG TPA: glutaredoxin 3 [Alphaproteobacteria bacterium]|nr:glutaredoxin 3 [Alphaproteobacteria bacterium]